MIMECHYTCSDSGGHKVLQQDNNVRTCQCMSVSVGGGYSIDSVNGGDCPSAALQDDPASSGSIYDVIVVSRGMVHIYIYTYTTN